MYDRASRSGRFLFEHQPALSSYELAPMEPFSYEARDGLVVRGYVTFNTLIFSDELPTATRMIAAIAEAGADAVIVQDLGLMRLIRAVAPQLPFHASTQTTLTEPRGLKYVQELGAEREEAAAHSGPKPRAAAGDQDALVPQQACFKHRLNPLSQRTRHCERSEAMTRTGLCIALTKETGLSGRVKSGRNRQTIIPV